MEQVKEKGNVLASLGEEDEGCREFATCVEEINVRRVFRVFIHSVNSA